MTPRSARSASARAPLPRVLEALRAARPEARVELDHRNPFELLVATILSAQSTDARVNLVTPILFRAWPGAAALAAAPIDRIEEVIRSTGFFRAKAKAIQGCARAIVERHGGEVPRTIGELTALPGVGRKTANVVLGAAWGIASGIVVDTHMARVARRLGWTRRSDPVTIEKDLMAIVPERDWVFCSIAMVLHGRYVCRARRPRCGVCALRPYCPSRHLEESAGGAGGGRVTRRRRRGGPRRRRPDRGRA
ncbi:MAG: endonuclease III [Candidatus Polarisedimenticolia bacterium]